MNHCHFREIGTVTPGRPHMRRRAGVPVGLAIFFLMPIFCDAQQQKVILAVGAPGAPEYKEQFESWANNWQTVFESNRESNPHLSLVRVGTADPDNQTDADRLKSEIESTTEGTSELWVVLIGHGTDDRKTSKFNMRGPDVSAAQLNEWLAPVTCRVVVINCTSASGQFITKLQAANRIVVTATKSGAQHNFTRFGGHLSEAISDVVLDLDKDQQTSLLEAFLGASSQTQEFYLQEARLATELAMIDDNGDGLGTPADWFEGTRVVRKSKHGSPDGFAANQVFLIRRGAEAELSQEQRQQREELEAKLEQLRLQKSSMTEDSYYQAIEPILMELSKIYAEVETLEKRRSAAER